MDYIWGNDTTSLYYFPQASTPFLYAPHPFDEINFGGVSQNGNYQQAVTIGGLNLTSNVLLNLAKANQGFSISTTSIDPTAAAAGISLTVTLNATLTGELSDTLYIYQGGLTDTLRIPLKAIVTNEFLLVNTDNIDSDKATIHWAAHPRATNYLIDVFDRDSTAGDLFFYYYACDLLGNNKAIGIYNGTNDTISLSKYELRQQLDGMGSYTNALQLHGTLAPKQCYILAHAGSTDATLVMQADTLIQNNNGINFMNFDGNDAIALYRSGILMDRIGAANETNDWGGNIIMVREGMMNHPQRIFDWREWQLHGITGYSNIKQHQITRGGQLYYERRKYAVGNVTHVEVDDLHPEELYTCVVYAIVGTDTIRSHNSMQI